MPAPHRRPLTDLEPGHEGRIADVSLGQDVHLEPGSPLRVGAHVYVVETSGRGWQHVRIDFREYSVPQQVAERVVVDAAVPAATVPPETDAARADEQYEVLLTRRRRTLWRVMVVHRRGAVVHSRIFDDREGARAFWAELRQAVGSMTAGEFRTRHGLP